MLDLTCRALPNTVLVGGKAFLIDTDFRTWLKFNRDIRQGLKTFDVGYIFPDERPESVDVLDLIAFANPKTELPRETKHTDVIVLDYDIDSDYIYAAFMEQYGIDLIDIPYLHWHKFLALIRGLNESTRLAKIMSYRCYEKNTNNKKDPYEELRFAWEIIATNPEEEKEVDELIKAFEVN